MPMPAGEPDFPCRAYDGGGFPYDDFSCTYPALAPLYFE